MVIEKKPFVYYKRIIEDILEYALIVFILLECKSLFDDGNANGIEGVCFVLVPVLLVALICLKAKKEIFATVCNIRVIGTLCGIEFAYIIYFILGVNNKSGVMDTNEYISHFLFFLPIMVIYILIEQRNGELFDFFIKHSNVITIFALISSVIYVCIFLNYDGILSDYLMVTENQYTVLKSNFYNFVCIGGDKYFKIGNIVLYRNNGCFSEPGTFGIPLLIGMYTELFLRRDKYSILRSIIISFTIITTGGTLPIIQAIVCWGLFFICQKDKILKIGNIFVVLVAGTVIGGLVYAKAVYSGTVGQSSFVIHASELKIGFDAFLSYPLLGCGYKDYAHLLSDFMPPERAALMTGFGNMFIFTLGTCGIFFTALCYGPIFVNIAKFYDKRKRNISVFFFGLFIITFLVCFRYDYQFIIMIAYGIAVCLTGSENVGRLINISCEEAEEKKKEKKEKVCFRDIVKSQILKGIDVCKNKPLVSVLLTVLAIVGVLTLTCSDVIWASLHKYYLAHNLYITQSSWVFPFFVIDLIAIFVVIFSCEEKKEKFLRIVPEMLSFLAYSLSFKSIYDNIEFFLICHNAKSDFLLGLLPGLVFILILGIVLILEDIVIGIVNSGITITINEKWLIFTGTILCAVVIVGVGILLLYNNDVDRLEVETNYIEENRTEFSHDAAFELGFEDNNYGKDEVLCELRIVQPDNSRNIIWRRIVTGKDIDENGRLELNAVYDNSGAGVMVVYDIVPSKGISFSVKAASGQGELSEINVSHYDCMNQPILRAFYLPDGTPKYLNGGYSMCEMDYDVLGHETAVRHYDAQANRVLYYNKFFERKRQYNDRGNIISEEYLGLDGEPILQTGGYSEVKKAYINDKVISTRYFGLDGKPVLYNGIYHEIRYEYDSKQLCTGSSFWDADGNPVNGPKGYASVENKYDDAGRLTDVWYFDIVGKATTCNQGFHHVKYENNIQGKVLEECYYDENEEIIDSISGYAIKKNDYNDNGQTLSEEYIKEDGHHVGDVLFWEYYDNGNLHKRIYKRENPVNGEIEPVMYQGKYYYIEYYYDNFDKLVREEYFDTKDKLTVNDQNFAVIQYEYDENGRRNRVTYYDDNRSPVYVNGQYCTITYGYDEKGNCNRESYFGFDDKPVLIESGVSSIEKSFDDSGNEIKTVYYGTDGNRIDNRSGYSELRRTFSSDNRCISEKYFAFDGRPINLKSGQHEKRMEYDENGNVLVVSYYDKEERVALLNGEYSKEVSEYNTDNLRVRVSYYVEDNLAKLNKGYSTIEYVYDENNNVVETDYLDQNDNLAVISDGYACLEIEYDENNREVERRYLDGNKKLCMLSDGYAIQKNVYNDQGRISNRQYYDENNNSTLISGCYSEIKCYYDEYGRVLRQEYYDANGNGTTLGSGQFAQEYTYDKIGYDWVTLRYLDINNKPVMLNGQYAGINRYYNKSKRVYKEEYIDMDSNLVELPSGYASYERLYDERGNMIQVSYFDKEGNPVNINGQYFLEARTYDSTCNMTKQVFYTVDGDVFTPEG